MPATTLSPLVAADRASLSPTARFQMRAPSTSRRERDLHEAQTQHAHPPGVYIPFDVSRNQHSTAMHITHNPLTGHGYGHPVTHPMRRTSGYAQWLATQFSSSSHHSSQSLPPPSPTPSGWLPHPPMMARVPPPPILHKVWILDCQSCGTFLTNRGMKAVLLLRPNVPLYSTDALPVNCSAQAMTAIPTASSSQPTHHSSPSANSPPTEQISTANRTCECLTQTLWCHGCGSTVGYMIVVPCVRCTSSITATNRTTNGHRFVFYSPEIVASERHYVSGENGIVTPALSPRLSASSPTSSPGVTPSESQASRPRTPSRSSHLPPQHRNNLLNHTSRSSSDSILDAPYSPVDPDSPPPLVPSTPPFRSRSSSASNMSLDGPLPLRHGDTLYWHQLMRSGEIPAVGDDPRARHPVLPDEGAGEKPDADSAIKPRGPRQKMMAGR